MTIKELEQLEFENVYDIPLLDELYVVISNEVHESGYLMYKIYGVAYGRNREITYAKCLSEISDVIHIVPTFLDECGAYYLPVLSMDSIETNLIHIFVRKAKIKVMHRLSDFEFEIIKKEWLESE